MPNLLEYLTRPNLEVNRTNLQPGPNSLSIGNYEVEGVQPWADFTLEKALDCFGDILRADIPSDQMHLPAPISQHHLNLTDESSVDAILKKHNHVIVDRSLQLAQPRLEGRGLHLPVSWSWGSLSHIEEDPRLRPDWAGTIHSGSPPYENRVPGDTKQSKKWRSTMKDSTSSSEQEEYWKPLRQVLLYCVRVNSRYGYIITDAEALFFRRTKSPEPSQSLSANRPRRQPPQTAHHRVTSITSVISRTTAMSLDSSGSPYTDAGNPDINEAAFEICVVPWTNSGVTQMSINLGVWFIHLLATSDISVQEWYPTLGTWQKVRDGNNRTCYRQVGSLRTSTSLPPEGILAGSAPSS
jgi:hypothetical protein